MLKLKLQYFGHLFRRANSMEKTLMLGRLRAGGEEGDRKSWLESITNSMDMNLRKHQKILKERGAWCAAVHGVVKSQTRLSG